VGVTFQLGIMVSSASAQIEAGGYLAFNDWIVLIRLPCSIVGGEHLRTTIQGPDGPQNVPNYALIQGIFIGCVAAYIIILALIGPENHGSHFERGKTAFQAGASKEDVGSTSEEVEKVQEVEKLSVGSIGGKEEEVIQHAEHKTLARDNLA
jgi:SHS family lactate transporter-like MFS transporter